jgi:hypothetical protein
MALILQTQQYTGTCLIRDLLFHAIRLERLMELSAFGNVHHRVEDYSGRTPRFSELSSSAFTYETEAYQPKSLDSYVTETRKERAAMSGHVTL